MNFFSPRGFMYATLCIGTERVHLFNTHLNATGTPFHRVQQVTQLVDKMNTVRSHNDSGMGTIVVLGGDFNCAPETREIKVRIEEERRGMCSL